MDALTHPSTQPPDTPTNQAAIAYTFRANPGISVLLQKLLTCAAEQKQKPKHSKSTAAERFKLTDGIRFLWIQFTDVLEVVLDIFQLSSESRKTALSNGAS